MARDLPLPRIHKVDILAPLDFQTLCNNCGKCIRGRLLTPKVLNFEGPILRKVARNRCFEGLLFWKALYFVKVLSKNGRRKVFFEE